MRNHGIFYYIMNFSPSIFYMLLYFLAVKGDGCPPPRDCISERECAKRLESIPKWQTNTVLYECGRNMVCCIENKNSLSQTPLQSTSTLQSSPIPSSSQNQAGAAPIGLQDGIKANLLPSNCGDEFKDRIVNGNVTEVDEFPWMVLLNITDNTNNANRIAFCGGSLINENYVLTAAHCIRNVLEGFTLGPLIIGEYNTLTEKDCYSDKSYCADPIQIRSIQTLFVHENYGKPASFKNDIALIRLNEKVNYNRNVRAICLPINTVTDETVQKYKFVLAGWGKTLNGRNQIGSSILQKGSVSSIQPQECNYNLIENNMVDKTQICTASGSRVEACNGDSGGPLIDARSHYKIKRSRWHQIGIVSFTAKANSCGEDNSNPTVYCRVEEYIDWILDKLEP